MPPRTKKIPKKNTAYTQLDMPVTKDMNVFADWGTHSAQPYRIHYALHEGEDDNSWLGPLNTAANASPKDNKTHKVTRDGEDRTYEYLTSDNRYHCLIAPDSAGFAYLGNTRTFYPKAGEPLNELCPDYNSSGYYPTLASHSIAVEYEENKEDPEHNVIYLYLCACGEYSLSGGIPLCGYRRLDNLCSGRRNGDEVFNQGGCDRVF